MFYVNIQIFFARKSRIDTGSQNKSIFFQHSEWFENPNEVQCPSSYLINIKY